MKYTRSIKKEAVSIIGITPDDETASRTKMIISEDVPSEHHLVLYDGAGRASVSTTAAIDAHIRIDHIDVTFRNSVGRAFSLTGTTSNTSISNSVSHDRLLVSKFCSNE